MMTIDGLRRSLVLCCTVLTVTVLPASAGQEPGPQAQPGPLVLERVESGFVVAPDFKITEVNDTFSKLMGVYGGWMKDHTLLVGAGGYWLTNRSDDLKMAYGGLVLGWQKRADRRVGFGAKGLVGLGEATLSTVISDLVRVPRDVRFGRGVSPDTRVRFGRQFFIVEPEATLLVKLTNQIRFNGGVGYRLIAGAGGFEEQLRGLTGSVALQIGE
jgi:hypothetical protein